MKKDTNLKVDSNYPNNSRGDIVNSVQKIVPRKEIISFGIAACGQGMIYAVMSSYISDFYINVLRTPLIFVLLLMLLARVWDAINDPLMGMIIDRATPKSGKMRPYIIISAIPIAILSFLMFYDFGLSATGTMVLASFVYVLWGMIYTVADVPFWSMPNIMTPHPGERANVISFGRTLNGIGTALPIAIFAVLGFILPIARPDLVGVESSKLRYIIIASVCSVIGIILFMFSYFGVKERVMAPVKKKNPADKTNTLKRILQCKPLMLVTIMGILSSGRYLMQAGAVHVARYAFYIGPEISSLADEAARSQAVEASISTVTTIFTVCSAIGMFGAMLVMPLLYKRFNYKQIIIFTGVAGFIAGVLTLVMGLLNIVYGFSWATFICIPFIIIQCIPLGALNVTAYAMIGDSLDYMEWKTGFRDTALGSACQGFVNKLGNAVATCLIVVVYILIQIDPAQIYSEKAVVFATDLLLKQRVAMFSLVSIVPGISIILCVIPVLFYDLVGKKKDQITMELAQRRIERESNMNL
ncbi:MAG: MFS transporter [Christensenellaceae bacterium]|jgi:Na+/melibiose symporter-like transporter|nr:MFS transporter [Christensenellaceae bacterium]